MLDLQRLRLLRELDRRGTVTAVARAFSYSQSAVSQQLATLEREAGVRLLEPAGRRLRLTPQAQLLVEHTELLLQEMERTEAALAASLTETTGTLRVASFQTAILTFVPPAIIRLAEEHPALRVEVTELEPDVALPALVADDFDVVIGEEYPGHPLPQLSGTARKHLLTDELHLAVPADRDGTSLADFTDAPFVMEPPDTPAGRWALTTCRQAGFDPDVCYTSTDLQIQLHLVQQQLAVALLPRLAGAEGRPDVRTHPIVNRPRRSIFTATRNGAANHPAISALSKALESTGGI